MPRVSVIVVSFNTRDLLARCLASLGRSHEVIVIDNASADGSAEMVAADYPWVKLIRNATNRGFGPANNQGLDAMTGAFALFLNSDAEAEPGAVEALADVLDADPGLVAAGGRLVSPDGSTQNSTANRLTPWAVFCEQTLLEKVFPRSRRLSPYWNTARLLASGEPVARTEQVMGACLMTRPVERFDERFFLYCEDTELCRRLRRHGEIAYVPAARFRHELGASSSNLRWLAVARYNRGKELYFRLHHGLFSYWVALKLDRLGALGRMLGWLVPTVLTLGLAGRFRRKVALFARVLFAPFGGPPRPRDTAQ